MNGATNDGTDGIHVDYAGIYNLQFSIQFANTDSQITPLLFGSVSMERMLPALPASLMSPTSTARRTAI